MLPLRLLLPTSPQLDLIKLQSFMSYVTYSTNCTGNTGTIITNLLLIYLVWFMQQQLTATRNFHTCYIYVLTFLPDIFFYGFKTSKFLFSPLSILN